MSTPPTDGYSRAIAIEADLMKRFQSARILRQGLCREYEYDTDGRIHVELRGIPEQFEAVLGGIDPASIDVKASRYLELQRRFGGMLVEVIDRSVRRCFNSDQAHVQPREPDVLRLVAAALRLAQFYGYTLADIVSKWDQWEKVFPEACPVCGIEHDIEPGCPPQEPRRRGAI